MMPSACKNSEKLTIGEMETPFKACISAVEKKARNLEKRKVTIVPINCVWRWRSVHGCHFATFASSQLIGRKALTKLACWYVALCGRQLRHVHTSPYLFSLHYFCNPTFVSCYHYVAFFFLLGEGRQIAYMPSTHSIIWGQKLLVKLLSCGILCGPFLCIIMSSVNLLCCVLWLNDASYSKSIWTSE